MSMPPNEAHAIRVARALGDPTRFRLLRAIAARVEMSCAELVAMFPIAQATVSHHLKVLSEAGLVTVRRRGSFHLYRLRPGAVADHGRALGRVFARRARTGKERAS